jgi:hypothetical protein
MRKAITSIIIFVFTIAIVFFAIGICNKLNKQNNLEENIKRLPFFSFATFENTSFNSLSINQGPVLIVRYNPECEHCQYEISELVKSEIPESSTKILLVSSADRNTIIKFLDQFRLAERPEIIQLFDTAYVFKNIFGSDIVPSNYIYNKELKLVRILHGETKIETILKYLKECE